MSTNKAKTYVSKCCKAKQYGFQTIDDTKTRHRCTVCLKECELVEKQAPLLERTIEQLKTLRDTGKGSTREITLTLTQLDLIVTQLLEEKEREVKDFLFEHLAFTPTDEEGVEIVKEYESNLTNPKDEEPT